MSNVLDIPVTLNNQELSFKAHVVRFGYVQHIVVDVYGNQITIERDEEGCYRAINSNATNQEREVDVALIKALVGVLEGL